MGGTIAKLIVGQVDDGHGERDPLNLIVEIKGFHDRIWQDAAA